MGRIAAWTGTLVLHVLVIGKLWLDTAVRVTAPERRALTVDIDLFDVPPPQPPAPPPAPSTPAVTATSRAAVAAPITAQRAREPMLTATPVLILPEPVSSSLRLEQSRVAAAEEIAQESAPERRAFGGRSIDAMLPDGETGKLPGFRPRTVEETSDLKRQIGKLLQRGVPAAATDYDAPLDLLTEGWERAHHSSDQAECDREYAQFDSDLRHQLCGDVRPPR